MHFPAFTIGAHTSPVPVLRQPTYQAQPFLAVRHLVELRAASDALTPPTTLISAANSLCERARVRERKEQLAPHHAVIST